MTTWTELTTYLSDRGNHYGLSAQDLISQTPDLIQGNPAAILTFWQHKDISHVLPVSTHPDLAGNISNVFPEDPAVNRARQDDLVTPLERIEAWIDNQIDAIAAAIHWPF